jgi:hypothetical protein
LIKGLVRIAKKAPALSSAFPFQAKTKIPGEPAMGRL